VALQDRMKKFMNYVGLTEEDYQDPVTPRRERPFAAEPSTDSTDQAWGTSTPTFRQTPSVSVLDGMGGTTSRPTMRPAISPSTVRTISPLSQGENLEVFVPRNFNESKRVSDVLKSHRAFVLNLTACDEAQRKRLLDFTSGVVYALGAKIKPLEQGLPIYLVFPSHIQVSKDALDRLRQQNYIP